MRPWLSGITGPCQGSVGVSITPGRTLKALKGLSCGQEKGASAPFVVIETAGAIDFAPILGHSLARRDPRHLLAKRICDRQVSVN